MVEWRDPAPAPETGTRGVAAHFEQAARELRSNPGKWAVVATYNRNSSAYNTVTRIKHGQGAWGPSGAYEALAQKDPGQRSVWNVFARYVAARNNHSHSHNGHGQHAGGPVPVNHAVPADTDRSEVSHNDSPGESRYRHSVRVSDHRENAGIGT